MDLLRWKGVWFSLSLLLVSVIFVLIGRLFETVNRGEAFSSKSVGQIRFLAGCFMAHFAGDLIFSQILGRAMTRYIPTQHLTTFKTVGTAENVSVFLFLPNPNIDLTPPMLLLGLFAFTLAEVMRQGLLIKQENDLTV